MKIPYYQVNAFTQDKFGGNPAGVCLLEEWIEDSMMLAVAAENDLSETAFLVREGSGWGLRWFTPQVEVDLCGHATLASGFVIFNYIDRKAGQARFSTRSGELKVARERDGLLALDFPALPASPCEAQEALVKGLGLTPDEVLVAADHMAVVATEEMVRDLDPDMEALKKLTSRGVVVTAPGRRSDFVSRFFAPRVGIPEDPVTGSAHCTLVPYWAARLGKKKLHALQVSRRRGELFCEDRGERVSIAGHAVTYLEGTIEV